MRTLLCLVFLLTTFPALQSAQPTGEREWTSTAGTKLTARAVALDDEVVSLRSNDRGFFRVSLDQLIPADQQLLREHFALRIEGDVEAVLPKDLPHPVGEVVGPIDAGNGSRYLLYLPKTLAAGTRAPLFFWTGAGGTDKGTLRLGIEAAEICGMVLAGSVESRNGQSYEVNEAHVRHCLEHIDETLPVEIERVFFSGSSGGGAMSMHNCAQFPCAGGMPIIGYIPRECRPSPGGFYCVMGGARDFNRYLSASAAERLSRAIYLPYMGGHAKPGADTFREGMLWIYSRDAYSRFDADDPELLRFEKRFHEHLGDTLSDRPWLAYYWTNHLLEICEARGHSRKVFAELHSRLGSDARCLRYLEAHEAIAKFTDRHYVPEGAGGGSKRKHLTPGIKKAAERLSEELAGVPELEELAKALGQPTD